MQNLSIEETYARLLTDNEQAGEHAKLAGWNWRLWQTPTTRQVVGAGTRPESNSLALYQYAPEKDELIHQNYLLPEEVRDAQIVGVFWCRSIMRLVVALRSGHLLAERDLVGLVPEGLEAADASPSQDQIILIAAQGDLLLLDPDLEVVERGALPLASNFSAVRIAWRSDGAFFAVTHTDGDGLSHAHIFRAPGLQWVAKAQPEPLVPLSVAQVSPAIPRLSGILGWQQRRGGMLTAATQDGGIVFFEKNGLRHTRMDIKLLGEKTHSIWGLSWNADDTLLAVGFAATAVDVADTFDDIWVDIYAFRNYTWYLKYRIERKFLPSSGCPTMSLQFDLVDPLLLFMSDLQAEQAHPSIAWYRFQWTVSLNTALDDTIVVIDGSQVLLTPLRRALIPPPMCAYRASIPTKRMDEVIIHLHWSGQTLYAISNKHQWFRLGNHNRFEVVPEAERPSATSCEVTATANGSLFVWKAADAPVVSAVRSVAMPGGNLLLHVRQKLLQWEPVNASVATETFTLATDCLSFVVIREEQLAFWTTLGGSVCFQDLSTISNAAEQRRPRSESERTVDRGAVFVAALGDGLRLVLETPRGNLETIVPRILVERKISREFAVALAERRIPDLVGFLRLARRHCLEPRQVILSLGLDRFADEMGTFLRQFKERWAEAGVPETLSQLLVSLNEGDELTRRVVSSLVMKMENVDPERFFYAILTAQVTRRPQADLDGALQLLSRRFSAEAVRYVSTVSRKSMDELYRAALGQYDLSLADKIAQASRMDRAVYRPFLESLRRMENAALQRYEIDMFLSRPKTALRHLFEARKELGEQIDERIRRLAEHFHLGQEAYLEATKLEGEPLSSGLRHELALLYAGALSKAGAHLEAAQLYALHGAHREASAAYLAAGQAEFSIAAHLQGAMEMQQSESTDAFLHRLVEALCNQGKWEEAAQLLAGPMLAQPEEALCLLLDAHHFRAALRLISHYHQVGWLREQFRSALIQAADERALEMRGNAAKFRERAARWRMVHEHRLALQLHMANGEHSSARFSDVDGESELEALASDIASMSTFTFGTQSESSNSGSARSVTTDTWTFGAASQKASVKASKKKKKKKIKPGDPHEELYLVEYLRRLAPSSVLKEAVREIMDCLINLGEHSHALALHQAGKELHQAVQEWMPLLDGCTVTESLQESGDDSHATAWFGIIAL
jgi:hypothetical protein